MLARPLTLRASLIAPFVIAAILVAGAAYAESPWRPDGMADGMWIERRQVHGSSFDEVRVTATRPLDLERVCETIFAKGRDVPSTVRFKRREVLRESAAERWTYEQIALPWVADRDYVMHTRLDQRAETGRCEVSFETETDPGHPPLPGVVRIPAIRGHWTVQPTPEGQLYIRYEVFSDPGGGIPAFLARGGQRKSAVDFVKLVLAKASGPQRTAEAAPGPAHE